MKQACKHKNCSYSEKYDAEYCEECDEWMERVCCDEDCSFCKNRPSKPSKMKLEKKNWAIFKSKTKKEMSPLDKKVLCYIKAVTREEAIEKYKNRKKVLKEDIEGYRIWAEEASEEK